MTKRGLVLAGGGLAGIAWETGILAGIADEAPEVARALLDADVLLGTSAGSTVAAQLGSGTGLDDLFAAQTSADSHELDPGISIDDITALFMTAMTTGTTMTEKLQRIGAIAAATETVADAATDEPATEAPKPRARRASTRRKPTAEAVSEAPAEDVVPEALDAEAPAPQGDESEAANDAEPRGNRKGWWQRTFGA